MGAAINITKKPSLSINNKNFLVGAGHVGRKSTRGFLLNFINMAELDMMLVSHLEQGKQYD